MKATFGRDGKMLSSVVGLAAFVLWSVGQARGETVEQMAAMDLSLHTGNAITVAEKGREDECYFQVTNPSAAAEVRFRLHLTMTDYDGREFDWISDVLSAAPGKSVKIPLADVIPAVGWWHVRPTIRAADAEWAAVKPTRELAYIDPVGPCDPSPEDGFWFGLDSRLRSPEMLRLLAQMGVNILRFGTWAAVNPERDEFAWERFDEVVDAIRANGMQALYSVTFTPAYAVKPEYRGKGDPSRLPPRPEALQESLQKIVAHTRDKGVTIYDLWNEPDHRGFWRGSADDYLEFMRVAYQTIKTVQPDATVLSGGIASLHRRPFDGPNPDIDRRILLEGQQWYDAISLHEHGPFGDFASSLDGPLAEYRKGLSEKKPLWLTETGHDGSAHDKARVLVQKYTYARMHGAKGLVWYALYAPGQGGDYNIINAAGDPQPVIPAYNHMVRMMRGKRFAQTFDDSTQTGNRLFAFTDQEQTLLVAWGEGATAYRAPVAVADGAGAELYDIMGRRLKFERNGNTVYLPFARTPRYLQVSGKVEVGNYQKITPLALFEFGRQSTVRRHAVRPRLAAGEDRLDAREAGRSRRPHGRIHQRPTQRFVRRRWPGDATAVHGSAGRWHGNGRREPELLGQRRRVPRRGRQPDLSTAQLGACPGRNKAVAEPGQPARPRRVLQLSALRA